ncbi:hypothetical protein MXB_1395 [Myxobolus squamalis]|nr:hypothetical protein MXB_1395 [Myxobolus squamalis]
MLNHISFLLFFVTDMIESHKKIFINNILDSKIAYNKLHFESNVEINRSKKTIKFINIWIQGYIREFNDSVITIDDGTGSICVQIEILPQNAKLGDYIGILGEFDGTRVLNVLKIYVMDEPKKYEDLWKAETRCFYEYLTSCVAEH